MPCPNFEKKELGQIKTLRQNTCLQLAIYVTTKKITNMQEDEERATTR